MGLTCSQTLAGLPNRPQIMVVHDRPVIVETVREVLGADCEIITAADEPALLALCTATLPDLVLVDDAMPAAAAIQVLEQFKATQSLAHIPVIFIVAQTDSVRETVYLDAGAADFVTEPINSSVLRARVKTHLLLKVQSDQLRAMAFHDGLTGVYSRHYLATQMEIESARAKRSGSVLSLMMIDIDHFHAYNEYYGHQAGDDALRLVARVLESKLQRPGDLTARFGDDAFACLLPVTDFEPAMYVADQIEQAVRARGTGHASAADAPVVTISIGVVTRRRALDGGPEAMLGLADEQLRHAMEQGGARVCGKVLYRP